MSPTPTWWTRVKSRGRSGDEDGHPSEGRSRRRAPATGGSARGAQRQGDAEQSRVVASGHPGAAATGAAAAVQEAAAALQGIRATEAVRGKERRQGMTGSRRQSSSKQRATDRQQAANGENKKMDRACTYID
ncbi:hypothetical protein OsJ_26659 [Oryza sativa Japonica Group]|uniref:Uncharacterized protein n=1 Tax=Oryza sativa subsp. japonica TaxID=39947 RepID=B9FZY9_ORYSJ|nr:hypothetical protein OsJ_26659 [Oryza sativa Japonica Group]